MKKFILINAVILLLALPFASAAHYIIGIVEDAIDGTSANGQTVIIWNENQGMNINLTDIVGPSGDSGTDNVYMVDCDLFSPECEVGDELSVKVLNEGDNYLSQTVNVTVTGAGYNVVNNITLNSPPVFNSVVVDDELTDPENEINLLPATTKTVICRSIITDYDGEDNFENATGVFFDNVDSFYSQTDDNNYHYTNESCLINKAYGDAYEIEVNCSFNVLYYANAQSWNCSINATDNLSSEKLGSDLTTVNALLALGVPSPIQFGEFSLNQMTDEVAVNVTNYGNVKMNLSLSGYGFTENDGNAMNCTQGATKNISIEYEKFNLTAPNPLTLTHGQAIGNYTNLTLNPIPRKFDLDYRTNDDLDDANKTSYWRIYVPEGVAGNCQGNVIFGAVQADGV